MFKSNLAAKVSALMLSTTLAFSPIGLNIAEAIPANPRNLPAGWKQYYSTEARKGRYLVTVDNERYIETLITTKEPIIVEGKERFPKIWATTDLKGIPIKDKKTAEKADLAATIAYLDDKINFKVALPEISERYKEAANFITNSSILEKILKKALEIEGRILSIVVAGDTSTFSEAVKATIEQVATEYLDDVVNNIKSNIEKIEDISDLPSLVFGLENTTAKYVAYQLNLAASEMDMASKIAKSQDTWAYRDARRFYGFWKGGIIRGISHLEFWNQLREGSWEYAAKEIAESLSKGISGKSLEGILKRNKKMEIALDEFKRKAVRLESDFKRIEKMFKLAPWSDINLFKEEYHGSTPEEAFDSMLNARCYKGDEDFYELISGLSKYEIGRFMKERGLEYRVLPKDSDTVKAKVCGKEIKKYLEVVEKNFATLSYYVPEEREFFTTLLVKERGLWRLSHFFFWKNSDFRDMMAWHGKTDKEKIRNYFLYQMDILEGMLSNYKRDPDFPYKHYYE